MAEEQGLGPQGRPVRLALFDFDGTLIPGDSVVLYLQFARKKGWVNRKEYASALWAAVRYGLGRMSAEESKTAALRFRKKMDADAISHLDAEFVDTALLPRLFPQGRERVARHRREGFVLLLVSASTDNYMELVSRRLGFDGVLASPLAPDGAVRQNCKGEEKVRRVNAWLSARGLQADFAASFAYGDSKSDLPMLRLCGHPVQVNPKKKLRQAAPEMETAKWI